MSLVNQNKPFFIAAALLQGECDDAYVTSHCVGETTCVNPALQQSSRASILSYALQENELTRFCRPALEEVNLEIGPGQSIYCTTMAGVEAEPTHTKNS
jgi:hypothetical protein